MARIRILHLYSQVLDLYGDYRNIDAICQRIEESNLEVEVDRPELWDDLVLDGYDLVYIGHGKAANLAEVARVLAPHADDVRAHGCCGALPDDGRRPRVLSCCILDCDGKRAGHALGNLGETSAFHRKEKRPALDCVHARTTNHN